MTKHIRRVVINTQYGGVELSSSRKKEKMEILVFNALELVKKLMPKEKNEETPKYLG